MNLVSPPSPHPPAGLGDDRRECLTDRDQASLTGISHKEAQLWISVQMDQCDDQEYLYALRAAYNRAAPIHHFLPTEILIHVFAQIRPASIQALDVMLVCKTWRRLILVTPDFWAALTAAIPTITGSLGPNSRLGVSRVRRLEMILVRSTPRAIALPSMSFTPETAHKLSAMLEPHLARITSLTVTVHVMCLKNMRALLDRGMKRLTTLTLMRCAPREPFARQWSFSRTDILPSLQTLHISPCFVAAALPVPSLKRLIIESKCCYPTSSQGCTRSTSIGAVLQLLRQYPSLKRLDISQNIQGPESSPPTIPVPSSLPRLQELTIMHNDVANISTFLSHLVLPQAPETPMLRIRCLSTRGSTGGIPIGLDRLSVLPSITSIKVQLFDRQTLQASCYVGESPRLFLATSSRNATSTIGDFLRLFPSTSIVISSLHLSISNSSWALPAQADIDQQFERVLDSFPHLTHLTVRCDLQMPGPFIKALANGRQSRNISDDDSLDMVPFPLLRSLGFQWFIPRGHYYRDFTEACDNLLSALEWRKEIGRQLELFSFTFRRYGRRMAAGCAAETQRERLVALFAEVADEVVGMITL